MKLIENTLFFYKNNLHYVLSGKVIILYENYLL